MQHFIAWPSPRTKSQDVVTPDQLHVCAILNCWNSPLTWWMIVFDPIFVFCGDMTLFQSYSMTLQNITLLPARSINTDSYYWIFVVYHLVNLCKCSIVTLYLIINNNQNGVEKASSFFMNLFLADSPEFSPKWIIIVLWYTDDCLAVPKLVIDYHHSVVLLWMWPCPQKKKTKTQQAKWERYRSIPETSRY